MQGVYICSYPGTGHGGKSYPVHDDPVDSSRARHDMPSGGVRVFYLDYSAHPGSLALPGCDSSTRSLSDLGDRQRWRRILRCEYLLSA